MELEPEQRVAVDWAVAERPLGDAAVRESVLAALEHGGRPGLRVGVILVDDPTLAELHERFLDDPSPTDVISFSLEEEGEAGGDGPQAEIYASVDRARAVARERGVPVARELALYLVHGALHLCGMEDAEPEERARMRAAERAVLDRLGYPPDPAPHAWESDVPGT